MYPFTPYQYPLFADDPDNAGGGSGGGDDPPAGDKPPADPADNPDVLKYPSVQKAINAAAAKAKKEAAESAKELQAKLDEMSGKMSALGDFDPETVKALLTRMQTDEETRLLAEGKIDEVINKRTAQIEESWKRRAGGKDAKINELTETNSALQQQLNSLKIDGLISDAYLNAPGANPQAVRAIKMLAERAFKFNADGSMEITDGPIVGADGSTDPKDIARAWVDEKVRSEHPYLFIQPKGAGAKGNDGANGSGKPSRGKMTRQEKSAYIAEHGQDAYESLPY